MKFYYTYILKSIKDGNLYTGSTNDLKKRIVEHNSGKVISTKGRLPFELVYYEACLTDHDARMREKYLKTAWGKRYIKNRLKLYMAKGLTPLDRPVGYENLSNGSLSNGVKLDGTGDFIQISDF